MVEENTSPEVPVEGFSIDPSTWVEPKESFPGFVQASEYRWANEKYLFGSDGRPGVIQRIAGQAKMKEEQVLDSLRNVNPTKVASIPQWDLRVKRLDATLQLPDGSQVDAIRYGGFDLVKWSNQTNAFVPINLNYGKEAFISGEWKRIVGVIAPPGVLVGKFLMFDWWPSKRFGGSGSMPAKRVLAPTGVLPPTFEYTGEVRIIPVPERADDAGGGQAQSATTGAGGVTLLPEHEAIDRLITDFLPGANSNQAIKLVTDIPPELRVPSILNGLATGELLKKLGAQGRIVIAADGAISLPA